MYNLSSISAPTASAISQVELSRAGIPQIYQPANSTAEVQSNVVGILYFSDEDVTVRFVRSWYYWSVQLSQPLPHFQASLLNYKWQREIRVDGQDGGVNPIKSGVSHYHVDSQEGLNALVQALRGYFGETADLGNRYDQDLVLDDLLLAEEIDALIGLAGEYAQEKSEQDKNCAKTLLQEALSKAEGAYLNEQMSVAVFVLLKLHTSWAEEEELESLYYADNNVETARYHQLNQLNHLLQAQKLTVFCQENRELIETGLGSMPRINSFQRLMASQASEKVRAELLKGAASVHEVIKHEESRTETKYRDIALQRIVVNTLILYRIYGELGEHGLAHTLMLLARTINDSLPVDDRLDERFPEVKAWERFPKGSLAHLLHNTTIFSYPGCTEQS